MDGWMDRKINKKLRKSNVIITPHLKVPFRIPVKKIVTEAHEIEIPKHMRGKLIISLFVCIINIVYSAHFTLCSICSNFYF